MSERWVNASGVVGDAVTYLELELEKEPKRFEPGLNYRGWNEEKRVSKMEERFYKNSKIPQWIVQRMLKAVQEYEQKLNAKEKIKWNLEKVLKKDL